MEISIENAEKKFFEHIGHLNNDRILFSGKFGTGKSYFLKKYFNNRAKDYNLFWLTPVNYVVGANQDIFEWIKVDVAKDVLNKEGFSKMKNTFSDNLIIQTYIYNNIKSIFSSLLKVIANEKIKAETGIDTLKTLQKDIKSFERFKTGIKEDSKSDEDKLLQYLGDATQIQGSIYEDNLTTQIIRASIELLKHKTGKENVLVIDDLDRLDPEHIFRILNILSAHNSHFDSNKFGFDKVIVVCDYENIKRIYEYKYGEKVDFQGYIEKFYTYEPFYFTIYDAIVNYCENEYTIENLHESGKQTLIFLLSWLYKHKKLRVRNLKKIASGFTILPNVNFGTAKYDLSKKLNTFQLQQILPLQLTFEINYNQYDIIKVIWLLSLAFGNLDKFYFSFKELQQKSNYIIDQKYLNHINNAVLIFEHIAKNSNSRSLFFNWRTEPRNNQSFLIPIETTFLGRKYIIDTHNSDLNPYTGGDYFSNSTVVQLGETVQDVDKVSMLIESLSVIINFIKSRGIFSNLDVQD